MDMKDYIQIGVAKGLISFNEDRSRIKYIQHLTLFIIDNN